MIIHCKKLGFNLEGVRVVESCEKDFDIDSYTVFTCPALYHRVKDKVEDCRILDLRVLKAFNNPKNVATSILEAEKVKLNYKFEFVDVGKDVVYIGENYDLIKELSLHCNLTVVTENDELIKKLYPYEVRVIRGRVKGVEGSIGKFKVFLEGYDLVDGREVKYVECGQIIGLEGNVEGIYADEYYGAFKVLSNLGGYLKLVTVRINPDVCGVFKSGFTGCDFCLDCPSISLENGKIKLDLTSCEGCGFCSSICFTSAMENVVLPHDKIMKKINRVAEVANSDVIAFTCEKSLVELKNLKDLPDVAIILVPCLNYINEVHYLYTVLKGFKVLAVPCECKMFREDCFEIAYKTLKAFGFDCLRIARWKDVKNVLNELKGKDVPNVRFELRGRNKREMWLSLVESLMAYDLKQKSVDLRYFGLIKVDERCTVCKSCTNMCPMNAIRIEEGKIKFDHGLCIGCELCSKSCPENAVKVYKILDFSSLGERTVYECEVIRCPKCGKPHMTKKAYEKIKDITGMEKALLFCEDCRPIILLEGLYEEVLRDLKELRKRRLGE